MEFSMLRLEAIRIALQKYPKVNQKVLLGYAEEIFQFLAKDYLPIEKDKDAKKK